MAATILCDRCQFLDIFELLQNLPNEPDQPVSVDHNEEQLDNQIQAGTISCSGSDDNARENDSGELDDAGSHDVDSFLPANTFSWYTAMRDVYASSSSCSLCKLIMQGWRYSREFVIELNLQQANFDETDAPEDLYLDIVDIPAYADGIIQLLLCCQPKGNDDGRNRKNTYVLEFQCSPRTQSSWEAHDSLEVMFRVIRDGDRIGDKDGLQDGLQDGLRGEDGTIKSHTVDLDARVNIDALSESSVEVASIWLQNCVEQHGTTCGQNPTVTSFFPSRVLDVALEHGNQLFLRKREDCLSPTFLSNGDQRFVALTHCWGSNNQGKNVPFVTTRDNLDKLTKGISVANLPQTFKDAAVVARNLGVRYLWIDSLCIVQDSAQDWIEESSQMASIYREAYLVISAANSAADVDGFLGKRQLRDSVLFSPRSKPSKPDSAKENNPSEPLYLQLIPPSSLRWMSNTGKDILFNEPISLRAWCFQERFLPHRILHYGTHQMFWECQYLTASEEGDVMTHAHGHHIERISRTANIPTSIFNKRWRSPEDEGKDVNYADWYILTVEDYTARGITKDTDRLPALMGLANLLARGSRDTYIAGLWQSALIEGLMWYRVAQLGQRNVDRSGAYIAPSWSWASVAGPVQFPAYNWHKQRASWKAITADFEALATYSGHDLRFATANEYGALEGGELTLTAPVVEVESIDALQEKTPELPTLFGMKTSQSPVVDKTFCLRFGSRVNRKCIWIEGGFDRPSEISENPSIHVVFLARMPVLLDHGFFDYRFGLLVQKTGQDGKYRRIGFVDGVVLNRAPLNILQLITRKRTYVIAEYSRPYADGDMDEGRPNRLANNPLKLSTTSLTII